MKKEDITNLLNQVSVVVGNIEKVRKAYEPQLATKFSIFDIVGFDENMVSAMIAHLLNPKATHAQGNVFLKTFIDRLYFVFQNEFENSSHSSIEELKNASLLDKACVKTEETTDIDRRIDITVKMGDIKFGIENKLWAEEQSNQLEHYLDYIQKDCPKGFLVFLRIDPKREAKTISNRKERCKNGDLIVIDYNDILKWLDECIKVCKADNIRWYLKEFQQLI
ncbi:MAG: PD-(D/E)XK nuclease family protein, partial [Endomicrobium sp.]|nr:PD-(D/E)XK nuclease family protein [Endomicrobium sp.]